MQQSLIPFRRYDGAIMERVHEQPTIKWYDIFGYLFKVRVVCGDDDDDEDDDNGILLPGVSSPSSPECQKLIRCEIEYEI